MLQAKDLSSDFRARATLSLHFSSSLSSGDHGIVGYSCNGYAAHKLGFHDLIQSDHSCLIKRECLVFIIIFFDKA